MKMHKLRIGYHGMICRLSGLISLEMGEAGIGYTYVATDTYIATYDSCR